MYVHTITLLTQTMVKIHAAMFVDGSQRAGGGMSKQRCASWAPTFLLF